MPLKQRQLVLLLSLFTTLVISISATNACLIPTNNTEINTTTTLCRGDYHLSDNDNSGALEITNNNIKLDCNNSYIHGNDTGRGIYINTKNNITLTNCNISNYEYGIYITISSGGTNIRDSFMFSNENGLILNNVQDISVVNNTFISNSGGLLYHGAISIVNSNSNNSIIINNTIEDNSRGIYIASGNYNNITGNKIRRNNNNNIVLSSNARYTRVETNVLEPSTTYGGTGTISISNIFADWTAGPPINFLADFETITEALTSASADDIIYAFKKTYSECLDITKTITLTGEEKDSTTINCTSGIPVNITQDSVKLGNLTLNSGAQNHPALHITGSSAKISNITIDMQQKGIRIQNSGSHTLEYLKLMDIPTYGINITSSDNTTIRESRLTNSSISALSSTRIFIKNNTIKYTQNSTTLINTNDSLIANNTYQDIQPYPIQIAGSKNTNITGNTLIYTTTPSPPDISILLRYTTQSSVAGNTIKKSCTCMAAQDSGALTIEKNTINDTAETAITLTNTNSTLLANNTITTAERAIRLYSGNANTIYNNTITGTTDTSILFSPESTTTHYHNNTIEKNTIQDSYKAISMQNTYSTKISRNIITNTGNFPTIYLENATQDNITGNTFIGGTGAIRLKNANKTLTQGNNFSSYTQRAISFEDTPSSYNTENTIRDNIITGGIYPLRIFHNFKSRVINNTITEVTGYGIHISNTNSTNITNNTIMENPIYGIALTESRNNLIDNNTIDHSQWAGVYSWDAQPDSNPNNTISNNHIQNIEIGIQLENFLKPTIIGNTITSNQYEAIKLTTVNFAIIQNNTLTDSGCGLTLQDSYYNNISENILQNNTDGIKLTSGSSDNNLWLNNFSDAGNTFRENSNYYCIMGLDNYYYTNNPPYNNPPFSCARSLKTTHNDTAIYINDTMKFTTNTFGGESSYAYLNITINSTNYTMALTQGNNITGNWTYIFKDTPLPGTYKAAELYYHETDNDEGIKEITGLSFEVMELSMDVNIILSPAKINETIDIEAIVQNNASAIENVTSKIYWNNTLIDTQNQTTFTKINDSTRIYYLSTDKTHRSGTYTVNTTVYAGKEKTDTDTFQINYGQTIIDINETPQVIAHNRTTLQNYTIRATGGDLNNITITFESNNTSIINITTPNQTIPYLNASETLELYINITANNIGRARINITAKPENGTQDTETKDIEVKKINMTTHIFPQVANVTQNITIIAHIQNNATEITGVTAKIYWNSTHIATAQLEYYATMPTPNPEYIYQTTANFTERSGNYTVIITATATNNATSTVYYYINYGHANITIYTSPTAMNTNTEKQQYINITATNGDLNHTTITFSSNDTTTINITTATQTIPYLNSSYTQNLYINITANNTGTAKINITATPANGTPDSKTKNITVKELALDTSLSATTINITQTTQLHANITGNITQIEYVTANVTWNSTSKQNITLDYYRYYPAEEKHAYTGTITNTKLSGNYTVLTTAKAEITTNTTKTFFVNYGQAEITFGPDPQKLNVSENRTQEITIKPKNGDLANITVKLTSDNETILNLSDTQNPIQTVDYIFFIGSTENSGETIQYNLTGKSVGTTNITANVTSKNNNPAIEKKEIEVTGETETNAPNVTAIWTNSSINTYNLLDSITIYANISEDSGLKIKLAEITKPEGYKENKTMAWSGTGNTYKTQSPFTNTTNTSNYTIKIYAIDYYGNTNDTETKNFTVTDIYPTTTIETESLYNRGENATITIYVYDVNNNQVTGFNTTLNITYESNTTTLLENNQTGTLKYYINTSILGIHSLSANITKNGNTGLNTSTFNVSSMLNIIFIVPDEKNLPTPNPSEIIPIIFIEVKDIRGNSLQKTVNLTLTCYNNTIETVSNITMSKNYYGLYEYSGTQKCFTASGYSRTFNIISESADDMNNTGTKIISLTTKAYPSQSPPGGPGGGTSSGGGIVGIIQNKTDEWKDFILGNQTDTTIISDFRFTLSKKEIRIKQGEDTTIIATIDNIGDVEQKITAAITKQCCNITITDTAYTIARKNKKDIPIHIHNSLTTPPGQYLATITMASENITKTETATIIIEENPLIADLRNLENKIKEQEKDIESYTITGMDTSGLEKTLEELKTHIANAKQYIEKDDLKNLKTSISEAKKKSDRITLELLRLKTLKWLYENKEMIAITIITIIILTYLSVYFIIPYYYLKKELKSLETKELELKDAEKSVQKQYFMRQLDEATFSKLISEKHSLLLDTRSQVKQTEEKITLLTRGKLNLKEEQHSKYFILNKIAPKKQAPLEKKLQIEDKIKSLKEQEYNITQSIKEAEKNYYSHIITQDELEQITTNSRAKLESIKKQRSTLDQLQAAVPAKESKPKTGIISKIKQKYTQYKHQRQKARAENKMRELKKHEDALEKRDMEIKAKEERIKKEMETLKKETQPTGSE